MILSVYARIMSSRVHLLLAALPALLGACSPDATGGRADFVLDDGRCGRKREIRGDGGRDDERHLFGLYARVFECLAASGRAEVAREVNRRDRARLKVARFSPFGIIELTRQRVRPSLKRSVHSACPYCTGTGYIPSDETSCLTVVRKVRDNLTKPGGVLVVTVRPEVAEAVLNQALHDLAGVG